MDRLTTKDIVAGIEIFDLKIGVCEEKAFNLLGQYENTGLTPTEVAELAQANKQLKELLLLVVDNQNIGNLCEKCCADCIDAGRDMGDSTFQCSCFKRQHSDKLKGLIEI